MSNIPAPYTFLRPEEAALVNELIGTIKEQFGSLRFLEIGVCAGGTLVGVVNQAREIGCPIQAAGVDFALQEPQPHPLPDYEFHEGDSMEVWREIKGKFNFLFIDGCHCVIHSMCDFLNYSPFVEVGGFVLFHDTALPKGKSVQDEWEQNHAYAGVKNSKLGVREGLIKLGLLQGHRRDWEFVKELESESGMMGVCLFRKVAEL